MIVLRANRSMNSQRIRAEFKVRIERDRRARKVLAQGRPPMAEESVPRIARLLALAHKWEGMVRRGETDCVQLARQHGLSRARVSQVCCLSLLAPEIQESVLLSSLSQRCLTAIAAHPIWREQRLL